MYIYCVVEEQIWWRIKHSVWTFEAEMSTDKQAEMLRKHLDETEVQRKELGWRHKFINMDF